MTGPDLVAVPLRDGTELRLRASINALCDFESVMARDGFDPDRELRRIEAGLGGTVSAVRALIWACAKDQHEGLGLRHVGALIGSDGTALREGLAEALKRAVPDREEGLEAPGKPQPPEA